MPNHLLCSAFATVPIFMMMSIPAPGGARPRNKSDWYVYIGSAEYSGPGSKHIYVARFNSATGHLTKPTIAAETVNAGFLAVHPNGRFLYATNEMGKYKTWDTGGVTAFSIQHSTGKLTFLNDVSSRGGNPAFLTVSKTGRYVLVANYYGGKVAVFPVLADGRLGEPSSIESETGSSVNKERQEAPHPHSIYLSPDNRFALVPDLGLDKVRIYHFDPVHGTLQPNPPFGEVKPGSGPRHLAFAPTGKFVYVMNELQSTISEFSYDGSAGRMHSIGAVSTLPNDFKGEKSGAEIEMAPSGRFLYASNRGHDSIAVLAVDPSSGTLKPIEYVPTQGRTPRNFALDPSGRFLLVGNQDSNTIVIFRVDQESGRLAPTGELVQAQWPVCIVFAPIE